MLAIGANDPDQIERLSFDRFFFFGCILFLLVDRPQLVKDLLQLFFFAKDANHFFNASQLGQT